MLTLDTLPTYTEPVCSADKPSFVEHNLFVNEPSGFYTKTKRNVAKRNVNDILFNGWMAACVK
jgi:hypothetical protein